MKPRPKPLQSNHERWLVSYADFITLLFAFFVVLYASAQMDKKKVNELSAAIEAAFQDLGSFSGRSGSAAPIEELSAGSVARASTEKPERQLQLLEHELRETLASELARHEVAFYRAPDGLVLSLREAGFFDSGSAKIRPESREAFHRIALALERRRYRVRVEGHTDDVPIRNRKYTSNWELSTGRATEVIRLLITVYGFSPQDLTAAGYAEFHPVADNKTFEGRRNNRRVDLVIQEPGGPN